MIRFTQNIRLFCCILPNLSRQSNLFEILSGDPSPARAQCTEMQRALPGYQTRRQYFQFLRDFLKLNKYIYQQSRLTRQKVERLERSSKCVDIFSSSVYTNYSITPPINKVCAPAACTGHCPDMRQTIKE